MARNRAAILGLFQDPNAAAEAISGLRNAGFPDRDVEIMTDTPYPEGTFGERPEPHRLYVFPFVGAFCGFAVGLLLTAGTQLSYPLVTGGKPILSVPPMVIIMYEGTMLGALIFTVIGILFESRLPRLGGVGLYDPRITEGYIGIHVSGPTERLGAAEEVLRRAGAVDIRR